MTESELIAILYTYYTQNKFSDEHNNILKKFTSEGVITNYILKSVKFNMQNTYQSKITFDLFAFDCFLNKYNYMVKNDNFKEFHMILGKEINASINVNKYINNWFEADLTFNDFEKIIPFADMSDNGKLTLAELNILTHKDYPQDKKNVMYGITGFEQLLPDTVKDIFIF